MGGAQSDCKPPTHRVHVTTGDRKSHGTGFKHIDVSSISRLSLCESLMELSEFVRMSFFLLSTPIQVVYNIDWLFGISKNNHHIPKDSLIRILGFPFIKSANLIIMHDNFWGLGNDIRLQLLMVLHNRLRDSLFIWHLSFSLVNLRFLFGNQFLIINFLNYWQE